MNIDDGTFAQTADGKRCPMTNSINLPINTEAEYRQMEFDHAGQKHHFALVFAPMPKGEKFDIIENEDKFGGLNIHDIAVDTAQYCDKINIDEFVQRLSYKRNGQIHKRQCRCIIYKVERYYPNHLRASQKTVRQVLYCKHESHKPNR